MQPPIDLEAQQDASGRFLFGGMCDPVNGATLSDVVCNLKIAALFYDHILIPDGFLFSRSNLTKDLLSQRGNSIVRLLEIGALVPTLRYRNATSYRENLEHARDMGADLGRYLTLKEPEAFQVADIVDRAALQLAWWPEDMSAGTTNSYPLLLQEHFFDNPNSITQLIVSGQHPDHSSLAPYANEALRFIEKNAPNPRFGRRHLEDLIKKELLPEHSHNYAQYFALTDSPRERFVSGMLREASTIYQRHNAKKFKSDVHFFRDYAPHVLTKSPDSLLFVSEPGLGLQSREEGQFSLFDFVNLLTVDQILQIRTEWPRKEFVRLIAKHRGHPTDESRKAVLEHLDDSFRELVRKQFEKNPGLFDKYPAVRDAPEALEIAATVAHFVSEGHEEILYVLGVPVVAALTSFAHLIPPARWAIRYLVVRRRTEQTVQMIEKYLRRTEPRLFSRPNYLQEGSAEKNGLRQADPLRA